MSSLSALCRVRLCVHVLATVTCLSEHWAAGILLDHVFLWTHGTQTLSCGKWDLVPQPEINPGPLHWEHGVLVTGPPGKPLRACLADRVLCSPASVAPGEVLSMPPLSPGPRVRAPCTPGPHHTVSGTQRGPSPRDLILLSLYLALLQG